MKKFISVIVSIVMIVALCTTAFATEYKMFIHGMNGFSNNCDEVNVNIQDQWYSTTQSGETLEVNGIDKETELWLGDVKSLNISYEKILGEDIIENGEITVEPHGNGNHSKCVKGTVNFWNTTQQPIVEEDPTIEDDPIIEDEPTIEDEPDDKEEPIIEDEPTPNPNKDEPIPTPNINNTTSSSPKTADAFDSIFIVACLLSFCGICILVKRRKG